jgi:hypothetical protein
LVVSAEAKKLEEIRQREGNLNSLEAQAILGDLKRGHFSQESTGMFLAKSVLSGRMAYGVTSHYYMDKWMKVFFGETLAKRLPAGNRVELMWIGKGSLVRIHTNIPWRYLLALGESSRKFTDSLKKVLLKKIGKQLGHFVVENTLDKVVEDILRDHPSIPEATTVLRLNMFNDPRLMAPMVQAATPVPIAIPPEIRVQRDPVVSAASVQHQVIEEQHYRASSGGSESAQSKPVEHPTHSIPSSINIGGGSFTGGAGSSLFTRF